MNEIAYIDRNFSEFIPDFIKDRKKDVADIRGLIGIGDFEKMTEILKIIRETASIFGFRDLTSMSSHAVTVAKKKDRFGIGELTDKMEKHLQQIKVVYVDYEEECEMGSCRPGGDMF